MTRQPTAPPPPRAFRAVSNILAVVALLALADWGLSWWRGTPGYSCSVALAFASESVMAVIGMTGLVLGILGVTLGGAKYWMTTTGLGLMVLSLLGIALASDWVGRACG